MTATSLAKKDGKNEDDGAKAPPTEENIQAKEEMRKLASSTQFGGPAYILESTFMTERWIWLILFLIFAALTVHDLYATISQYIEEPTSTDTTINFNQTMSFNGTTFCVAYNPNKLNWGVDLKKPEQTRKVLKHFANEPDLLAMLQNQTQEETKSNDTNLISLVLLTTTMLGNIVKMENQKYKTLSEVDHFWGITGPVKEADGKTVLHIVNSTTESIGSVYRFYAERNVSLVDLYQVIGQLLLRQMYPTLYCERMIGGKKSLDFKLMYSKSNITWFGRLPFGLNEDRICFKPDDGLFLFGSSADGCSIKISPNAIYPGEKSVGGTTGGVLFDLAGHNVPNGDVTNMWGLAADDKKQVDIQIMGQYTSLDKDETPCNDQDSTDIVDCKGKCRAKKIYEQCGCWPLSWWYLDNRPAGARYCAQPTQGVANQDSRRVPDITKPECNETHFSFVIDDECAKGCKQQCQQFIFLYTEQKITERFDLNNDDDTWENRTYIYMDTPSFIYPSISQSWSFDIGKFFSDLGGNISLWLGGSIIGLIHIIIYSCRVGVDAKYGKEIKAKEAKLAAKAKEGVLQRMMNMQGMTPERMKEQQQALFRYALQNALRTYNIKMGRADANDRIDLANPDDEQMVQAILANSANNELPAYTTMDERKASDDAMMQLLAKYEERIATLERMCGVHAAIAEDDSLGKGAENESLGKGAENESLGKGAENESLGKGADSESQGKATESEALGKTD